MNGGIGMEKVSVIIPVYNSELFIRQCIQSVINQTYPELEIIIVDDGSEDSSRSICEEISSSDERIQLFFQNHKGVSSARNCGLGNATGKYVFFLDSDDAIHPRLIEILAQKAETYHAELVFCTCKRLKTMQIDAIINRNAENYESGFCEIGEEKDSGEWFHWKYDGELSCIGGKLIRKSAIGTIRFDECLSSGEDTVFMYHLICKRIKMVYYQKDWYYYRMHSKSITHCDETLLYEGYFKKYEIIRDSEYQKEHYANAIVWEKRLWGEMRTKYLLLKSIGDEEGVRRLKKMVIAETKHPMFHNSSLGI